MFHQNISWVAKKTRCRLSVPTERIVLVFAADGVTNHLKPLFAVVGSLTNNHPNQQVFYHSPKNYHFRVLFFIFLVFTLV